MKTYSSEVRRDRRGEGCLPGFDGGGDGTEEVRGCCLLGVEVQFGMMKKVLENNNILHTTH